MKSPEGSKLRHVNGDCVGKEKTYAFHPHHPSLPLRHLLPAPPNRGIVRPFP
jgi:hypothetical protein